MTSPTRLVAGLLAFAVALGCAQGAAQPNAHALEARTSSQQAFLDKVRVAAQDGQRTYGVPASVSIAQAILASDWGRSKAVELGINYFGTRCGASLTAPGFASLADAQVGKPYVLGAETTPYQTDPPKFDCSELVEWVYARSGNKITDLAASQYQVTKPVTDAPKAGDLVFLRNNPARFNGIGHVAMLTKKLSNGDWRIIEARGRDYGVVRSTLSYWKQRSYYAGLRRYSSLKLAGVAGIVNSLTTYQFQAGCFTLTTTTGATVKYRSYRSTAAAFADRAATIAVQPEYKAARAATGSIGAFVDAIAAVERPGSAAAYAKQLKDLIARQGLTGYDVVPLTVVLKAGAVGAKVTALQYLLRAAGRTVSITDRFDTQTVAAVKAQQKAKGYTVDGEAGPKTLRSLLVTLKSGATGSRVSALSALLTLAGQKASGSSFDAGMLAAVKAFQASAGLPPSGTADGNTWSRLLMLLEPSPVPAITGTSKVGETLTAVAGSWGPGTVGLGYRWYRNGAAIDGATAATYAVAPADAEQVLTVRVTGSRAGWTSVTRTSLPTAAITRAALTATPTPTITGTAAVGKTLTAVPGGWAPAPVTLAYQWRRDGKAIAGATGVGYPVAADDLGTRLSVTVTGSKPGHTTIAKTSAVTAAVAKGTLTATPKPTITGTAKVGLELTAVPGTWAPDGVALRYQWRRNGTAITGATAASYRLVAADLAATITVTVTGSKAGYTTVGTTSVKTAAVAKGTLTSTPTPTITGTRAVGRTLTAKPGTWAPSGVTLRYQWFRGTIAITNATKATYTVTTRDKGTKLTVRVRGSKAGYVTVYRRASTTIA